MNFCPKRDDCYRKSDGHPESLRNSSFRSPISLCLSSDEQQTRLLAGHSCEDREESQVLELSSQNIEDRYKTDPSLTPQ